MKDVKEMTAYEKATWLIEVLRFLDQAPKETARQIPGDGLFAWDYANALKERYAFKADGTLLTYSSEDEDVPGEPVYYEDLPTPLKAEVHCGSAGCVMGLAKILRITKDADDDVELAEALFLPYHAVHDVCYNLNGDRREMEEVTAGEAADALEDLVRRHY